MKIAIINKHDIIERRSTEIEHWCVDENGIEHRMIQITGTHGAYSILRPGEKPTPEHTKWPCPVQYAYLSNALRSASNVKLTRPPTGTLEKGTEP